MLTPSGRREDVFTVNEGTLIISCPDPLCMDSFSDIEEFLDLWLRIRRRAVEAAVKAGEPPEGVKP